MVETKRIEIRVSQLVLELGRKEQHRMLGRQQDRITDESCWSRCVFFFHNTLLRAIAGSYVVIIYVVIFHFWGILWCRRPPSTDVR